MNPSHLLLLPLVCCPLPVGAGGEHTPGVDMQQQLKAALTAKGPGYRPRTEHLLPDGSPRYLNRLILEDSPYLLQHAHNPVDWHAWGEEAFDRARREGKPIFLSIGYSTCHWCHVMERESFEDPAIAEYLNQHFIAIKVDRETRPDLDETYMTAVTLISGQGGWPMSSFLTPAGKPFFGGTYYPPERFSQLLRRIQQLWQEQPAALLEQAEQLSAAIDQAHARQATDKTLTDGLPQQARVEILRRYDELQGGFSQAPKFPHEPWLYLLSRRVERHQDAAVRQALTHTLDAMAQGGIYDQIGGGFHRYATDNEWLVPHFEKMLYNQAHLARIYSQAWRATGQGRYRRIATETLDYVLREMASPEGAFYSATDADSEGEEGRFFVWRPEEIDQALSGKDARMARELYGVSAQGNLEGRNIPHLRRPLDDHAKALGLANAELESRLQGIKERLRAARNRRPAPLRDDKVITAWNGMMIGAFAQGALLLGNPSYAAAAERAAQALWSNVQAADGRLWRILREGRASVRAGLEDYACLAEGLLLLYDLNGDRIWLDRAAGLADRALALFGDGAGGLFLSEANLDPTAMPRPRADPNDNATPSAVGVLLHVLQRLWRRGGDPARREQAETLLRAHAGRIEALPLGFAYGLLALEDLREGERDSVGYAARGGIRLSGTLEHEGEHSHLLRLRLEMGPGLHINSHQPVEKGLVPTSLQLTDPAWRLTSLSYPEPSQLQPAWRQGPLSLFEGTIELGATLERDAGATGGLGLKVRLQACDATQCLPPEDIGLLLGQPGGPWPGKLETPVP